jgi:hypothetical protein
MPSWPSCAWKDCGWPGILKVEHVEEGEPITAFLCVWHILKARQCIVQMTALARHDRELGDGSPEAGRLEQKELP